jgi:hypothetical protein
MSFPWWAEWFFYLQTLIVFLIVVYEGVRAFL